MMICKRCKSQCPSAKDGYCFHCHVAVALDEATNGAISDGRISEGFPDFEKPKKNENTDDSLKS